jgi:high affinity Mn2+ porin
MKSCSRVKAMSTRSARTVTMRRQRHRYRRDCAVLLAACLGLLSTLNAHAAESIRSGDAPDSIAAPSDEATSADTTERWNVHGQFTLVAQSHGRFTSPYQGQNSLTPGSSAKETADATAFFGARLWRGGEFYLNPEIDQGFGLSDTVGIAGFPSGEAYKVGSSSPYLRLNRAFLRHVVDLGGESERVESAANALAGMHPTDNLTFTIGKLSVVDIFDNNAYAHDPRADFLNWSVIDAGAFDYAADAWGYTYGGAVEWSQSWWTLRGGAFALSDVPNSKDIDRSFHQYSLVAELEVRHTLLGNGGKVKLLGFVNRGRMASYDDAMRLGAASGTVPDVAAVRRYASRPGLTLNVEQSLAEDLGFFVRLGANDGSKEAFEFTEINKSASTGFSLKGNRWHRSADTLGLAVVVNGLSAAARDYFAAGGTGILIGDGRLPHYGSERIFEAFYSASFGEHISFAADFQRVDNPAYNRDRGPVSILGFRAHAEF